MKLPLKWLENYIQLEHNPKEFADIMTKLEFMQDGPIKEVAGQQIVDLEVRQNRPDCLSILGLAREYASYINKKIALPQIYTEIPVEWGSPKNLISVTAKDITKRFCAVHIKNIKVQKSPDWMKNDLEAYGIPSINNIVDITNYVMLEHGMPLHAFDYKKLTTSKDEPTPLTIRKAKNGENLTTWQNSEIEFTNKDLIISSGDNPVGIAGIIGGANSDIDENTTDIILESACYDQASIRKTSIRHNLRTDASTRHEKFLNPDMVETAIRRALFLISELAGGEIVEIEDFYEEREAPIGIEFNLFELSRIGGVQLNHDEAADYLVRLGFEIIEQKEAIGLNQNIIVIKVPMWRTDVQIEADVLEEILRLWGYENLPMQPLREAPEDFSTYESIQLEEKIRDILVKLGLDEHITNPLVKYNENNKYQIKLENPLNKEKDALRTHIVDTLRPALITNKKVRREQTAVFEVGKVYSKVKEGEFREQKVVSTLYDGHDFAKKIKPDFLSVMINLGFNLKDLKWEKEHSYLIYKFNNVSVGVLRHDGFDLMTDALTQIVDLKIIPVIQIKTTIPQVIVEEISFIYKDDIEIGKLEPAIYKASEKISRVSIADTYKDEEAFGKNMTSTTISITFEDIENSLTREDILKARNNIIDEAKRHGLHLRST